jgi:hypothetical protein
LSAETTTGSAALSSPSTVTVRYNGEQGFKEYLEIKTIGLPAR